MQSFNLAIVSPSSPKDVAGTITVYANDVKDAIKRVKNDPEMAGVRIFPLVKQQQAVA